MHRAKNINCALNWLMIHAYILIQWTQLKSKRSSKNLKIWKLDKFTAGCDLQSHFWCFCAWWLCFIYYQAFFHDVCIIRKWRLPLVAFKISLLARVTLTQRVFCAFIIFLIIVASSDHSIQFAVEWYNGWSSLFFQSHVHCFAANRQKAFSYMTTTFHEYETRWKAHKKRKKITQFYTPEMREKKNSGVFFSFIAWTQRINQGHLVIFSFIFSCVTTFQVKTIVIIHCQCYSITKW
jgi:hypothetical protein